MRNLREPGQEQMGIEPPADPNMWQRLPGAVRGGVALGLSGLAIGGVGGFFTGRATHSDSAKENLHDLAAEVAAYNGVKPETVLGEGLQTIPELPGYQDRITPTQYRQLTGASFLMIKRLVGTGGPWLAGCTTTKVEIANVKIPPTATGTEMITANHCLSPNVNLSIGTLTDKSLKAVNALQVDKYEYAIAKPLTDKSATQTLTPIAKVKAVSQVVNGQEMVNGVVDPLNNRPDAVLLTVTPLGQSEDIQKAPSITLPTNHEPRPGEEVLIVNAGNYTDDSHEIVKTGRYIGALTDTNPNGVRAHLRLVAISATDARQDALENGASGGLEIGASGTILGPLSNRFGHPYEKNMSTLDASYMQQNFYRRLKQQEILKVKYDKNTVVAANAVLTPYILSILAEGLGKWVTYPTPQPATPKPKPHPQQKNPRRR